MLIFHTISDKTFSIHLSISIVYLTLKCLFCTRESSPWRSTRTDKLNSSVTRGKRICRIIIFEILDPVNSISRWMNPIRMQAAAHLCTLRHIRPIREREFPENSFEKGKRWVRLSSSHTVLNVLLEQLRAMESKSSSFLIKNLLKPKPVKVAEESHVANRALTVAERLAGLFLL